jgi:hypothetical protein
MGEKEWRKKRKVEAMEFEGRREDGRNGFGEGRHEEEENRRWNTEEGRRDRRKRTFGSLATTSSVNLSS